MKNVSIIVVLGVCVLGGLGVWYFLSDTPVTNYPNMNTGPVLMFGDSLVEGVGASVGQTLPDQLERLLKVPVLNYGVSGDTTRDALLRLNQAVAEKPKIAIILLGGNDFLRKIPREETFTNLEKIVTAFQGEGAITVVLGVRSGIVGGGADEEYEALAKRTGSVYMSDVLAGLFGRSELMSDALHPNDQGYAQIAERLAPLLSEYIR